MFDVVFRNCSILDGTGSEPIPGDVAVVGDRIAHVGVVPSGDAATEIDLAGLTLAPGFVDVHTHDDDALLKHPGMEFKVSQGCTSLVIGNCGFSASPAEPGRRDPGGVVTASATWCDLAGYGAEVSAVRPAVNAMALVGHNTVRSLVMGDERRPPTDSELAAMGDHVARSMEQGACGFSTGLVYRPGRWASTDELVHLAGVAAQAGGLYASHIRNEADKLLDAVAEAIDIGRQVDAPVQISHHKAAGPRNWGRVVESLALVDEANRLGSDITLDVYPYTAGSGPMAQYFDINNIDADLAEVIRFATCPAFREYEGRMAVDLAAEQGVRPADVIHQVLTAPQGDRTVCIQFLMAEDDIETNLRHPRMMVGSDGIPELDGKPHPRLYGTFPRVLGHYVRERGVCDLADIVQRMTSLACDRFGLVDRGRIAEGQFADLVAFDPSTVIDQASYDEPQTESAGISLVVVNGRLAYQDGLHTGVGAGRMLRYRA